MQRLGWLGVMAWLMAGCVCSNGRFFSDTQAISKVRHDEFVDAWRVNGRKVCATDILAESGCYVLEVEYNATYSRAGSDAFAWSLVSPVAGAIAYGASAKYASYDSGRVPFALRVRSPNSYYVTATFTGDQFIPRIVESNAAGEHVGQIDPIQSDQELADCKAGKPAPTKVVSRFSLSAAVVHRTHLVAEPTRGSL